MTDWAALGTPLRPTLEPAIYVEPRDKRDASEDERQAELVAHLRKLPSVRVAAIPNGAKRSKWEAAKAKREGMAAGWPDIEVVWADGTARIEMKNGSEMPRANQIETLNWLHLRGHAVAVCRTKDGALRWLRECGAPVGGAI